MLVSTITLALIYVFSNNVFFWNKPHEIEPYNILAEKDTVRERETIPSRTAPITSSTHFIIK